MENSLDWKPNVTLDTGTVILYITSSPIVFFNLTITFCGFWQRPTSANWIVTGVYDICQVLKGVQISSV